MTSPSPQRQGLRVDPDRMGSAEWRRWVETWDVQVEADYLADILRRYPQHRAEAMRERARLIETGSLVVIATRAAVCWVEGQMKRDMLEVWA